MRPDNTLRTREMIAMIALFIGVKLTDTTATLYSHRTQNGLWLSVTVSLLVIIPSFFLLLYLLKKYKDKNLVELLEHILGKHVGKLFGFAIFLTSFALLILDSRNYVDSLKLLYFPQSPTKVITILFLAVCFFSAKRGLQAIGSTSWIVLPFIKMSMFFLAFLILGQVVFLRIFPIFGTGFQEVIYVGVKNAAVFSELFLLTIAYTSLKGTKYFRRGSYIGTAFATMEIVIFFLLYALVFDYKSIGKVAYPFHDITQYVNFGDFFTNVETFFMVFWLSAAFLRFIIYLYLIAMLFGAVFNIKEFETLLLPISFIAICLGLLTENAVINEFVYREQLLAWSTPFYVFLPILLWLIAKIKGDLKRT